MKAATVSEAMTQEQRELIQMAIVRIKEVQGHQTNAAGLKDYATLGYVWSKLQQAIRDDEKRKGA